MRNGVIFQLVLPEDLNERVTAWQHANRIANRSSAVRELLARGIDSKAPRDAG